MCQWALMQMNGLSKCVVLKKQKKMYLLWFFFILLGQNGVENLNEYVANGVLKIFNIWMANAESFCFKSWELKRHKFKSTFLMIHLMISFFL